MSEVTDDFWEKYTADEPEHSDVHLLPYPIRVEQDGTVGPLDDPNVRTLCFLPAEIGRFAAIRILYPICIGVLTIYNLKLPTIFNPTEATAEFFYTTSNPVPLQFPDTEAQVIGTKSGYLPGKLTT